MGKPEIRFKGYTDEWEQRKLKDIIEYIVDNRGKNPPYYCSEGIPVIDNFMIQNTLYPDLQTATRFIDSALYNDFIRKYNEEDDTLLTLVGNGIGNITLFPKEKAVIIQNTLGFRAKKNRKFLFFLLMANNEKLLKLDRGMAQPSIRQDEILDIDIHVPSESEQTEIGKYFTSIDNLITLHQRKCAEIKSLKKYMLQKMFPQNEQKVPEIRFEGFTEAWEQRKLGDVAEFSKGSGYSKGDLIESGTPIILYGRLYTKYETIISDVDTFVEAKDGSVYSKGGEVIVPASGETAEDIARAASVDKSGILLGGDLNVVMPNEDINSIFLAISISNGSSQRELARKAQGKSVVHIHNEEIRNLIVPFPTKTEQNKIENYFADLDHLITLHQQKCEELKKIKKFMLQKMFV